MNITSLPKTLNLMKLIAAVVCGMTLVASSSFADGVSGVYKIAAVENNGEGFIGNVRVGSNNSFSGSVYSYYYYERTYLRGFIDSNRNMIFSPRPTDISSISGKIRKRKKMVVGVSGNFRESDGTKGWIVGYKLKQL
jgi:hypothetical protein